MHHAHTVFDDYLNTAAKWGGEIRSIRWDIWTNFARGIENDEIEIDDSFIEGRLPNLYENGFTMNELLNYY